MGGGVKTGEGRPGNEARSALWVTTSDTRLFLPIVGSLGMRPKILLLLITVPTAQGGHVL